MPEFGGEVTNPKIIDRGEITDDGLLSEIIFGPKKSYECKCKRYNIKSLYEGQTCPKCGVMCISNDSRFKTFGKITLLFSVIKPTKKNLLTKIIGKSHKYLLDPNKSDMILATTRYLAFSNDLKNLKIVNSLIIKDMQVIPLRITGVYSFILALKYLLNYQKLEVVKQLFDDGVILDIVKVLPPDIRPISKDPNRINTIRENEINKPYTSLISLNKSNSINYQIKTELESDWLERIHLSFTKNLNDEIVDHQILSFDTITSRYQYYIDVLYDLVLDNLSGKTGFIRSSILGKTIEFSGRSVITINPSLPPYKIKVSKKILYKLWFPYFLNYMHKKHPEYRCSELYDKFVVSEYNSKNNNKEFDEFLNWFLKEERHQELRQYDNIKTIIRMKSKKKE